MIRSDMWASASAGRPFCCRLMTMPLTQEEIARFRAELDPLTDDDIRRRIQGISWSQEKLKEAERYLEDRAFRQHSRFTEADRSQKWIRRHRDAACDYPDLAFGVISENEPILRRTQSALRPERAAWVSRGHQALARLLTSHI